MWALHSCVRLGTTYPAKALMPIGQAYQIELEKSNEMIQPLLFDAASDFADGLAAVRMGDRLGYIDHTGNLTVIVADPNVGISSQFTEDLAIARAGDYYGYIDRTGHWAIEVQFKQAKGFVDGLAAVQGGSKYGFINPQGEWMIEPQSSRKAFG